MSELISTIIAGILMFIGYWIFGTIGCSNKSIAFEAHDFGITTGCMVKHKGKWLPLDNIRGFD